MPALSPTVVQPVFAAMARAAALVAAETQLSADTVLLVVRRFAELRAVDDRRHIHAQRRQLAIASAAASVARMGTPTPERLANGAAEIGERGAQFSGALETDPITLLRIRRSLTPRQVEAADCYRQDFDLAIAGVRNTENLRVSGGQRSGLAEAVLFSMASYQGARERLGQYVGIAEAVVCAGESIDQLARRRVPPCPPEANAAHQRDFANQMRGEKDRLLWSLRAALDILGDAYGLQAEIVRENLPVGDPNDSGETEHLVMSYRHEANGRVSGVALDGVGWHADAPNVAELRGLAAAQYASRKPT